MIEFKGVSFSYGEKEVLKNFNLMVNDGDRICLFGESGIGKTTVLRLILGLEKDYKGKIINTSGKVAVVFQENRLLPYKTVEENIRMFSRKDKLTYILSSLGIEDARSLYPSELSGGMARRASIARALNVDADVYIFDEPFTGLDQENISNAINLINELTVGKTIITVLHDRFYVPMMNCEVIEMKSHNYLTP